MIEKRLAAVPPIAVTAPCTFVGAITLTTSYPLKVKQKIILNDSSMPQLELEVKRVPSPNVIEVGPAGDISLRANLTGYGTTSFVYAIEQSRPNVPLDDRQRAVYEEEPILALRNLLVDPFGNPVSLKNPLPVQLSDGSINIETLNAELRVQLSAKDNDPKAGDVHSSVRLGDGANELVVNPDGSVNVNVVQSSSTPVSGLLFFPNEVSAVPSSVETTLISLIAPPQGYRFTKVDVSGENIALFKLKLNGSVLMWKRTWWNQFNQSFSFENFQNGLKLLPGDVLTVTVYHQRPNPANFEVTCTAE